jgi:colicin import membrane protein
LVTSVLLHAAILGWALFTIQAQRELRVAEPEPIAVDLVSAADHTKLRQGARTAKQLEAQAKETKAEPAKKEAPKPAPAAAAPPPPPPPPPPTEEPRKEEPPKEVAAVPPPPAAPPPVPAPEEQKKLDDMLKEQERQAEEQRKAEEQKRAEEARKQAELKKRLEDAKKKKEAELKKKREEERKRAEAQKKQFDAERIAALLNKAPDRGGPAQNPEPNEPTKAKGPVLGAPEGRDRKLSASEEGMLTGIIRSRLRGCWRLPAGGGGSDTPVVTLKWRLKPDGSLDGEPQIEHPRGDPLFRIAAEAAMRAVQQCSPFPLPPDKYGHWKNITWEFDPSQMM